jgi:hypothetical protein
MVIFVVVVSIASRTPIDGGARLVLGRFAKNAAVANRRRGREILLPPAPPEPASACSGITSTFRRWDGAMADVVTTEKKNTGVPMDGIICFVIIVDVVVASRSEQIRGRKRRRSGRSRGQKVS